MQGLQEMVRIASNAGESVHKHKVTELKWRQMCRTKRGLSLSHRSKKECKKNNGVPSQSGIQGSSKSKKSCRQILTKLRGEILKRCVKFLINGKSSKTGSAT